MSKKETKKKKANSKSTKNISNTLDKVLESEDSQDQLTDSSEKSSCAIIVVDENNVK